MPYIYNDEDNVPMNEDAVRLPLDPVRADRNCHERCRFGAICFKMFECKGSNNPDYPAECGFYDRLLDLDNDAQCIERELSRERGDDDG